MRETKAYHFDLKNACIIVHVYQNCAKRRIDLRSIHASIHWPLFVCVLVAKVTGPGGKFPTRQQHSAPFWGLQMYIHKPERINNLSNAY